MSICFWQRYGDVYEPDCRGGDVTDMELSFERHYDYCPFCGRKARYGRTRTPIKKHPRLIRLG